MAVRITKYEQAFDLICVPFNDKAIATMARLEKEGHSEKSICFAIWKESEYLYKRRRDDRFWGILVKVIKTWSWPKGDPRWDAYWQRKNEEKRLQELEKQIKDNQLKYQDKKKYPGFIYFIQGESGGAIKIGYATNVANRLRQLQTGYPDTLKALLAIPGNVNNEKVLHNEFKDLKLHGEWFKPEQAIFEKIKQLEGQYYPHWDSR